MSFKELESIFDKVTSWPQLISKLLVTPAACCLHAASDWPCTFLHPRCFRLAFFLPFQSWHRMLLTKDISTAAFVHMWQLVEHAKSPSVAFINCKTSV